MEKDFFEDIEVIYQLDETKNQRIIIIRGEESKEPINVVTSLDKNKSYYHGPYLKKLFEHEYLDDLTMQKTKDKIDGNFYMTRSIIYYLANKYNDIIFTEITGDDDLTKSGIFFVPQTISKRQYENLKEMLPYFQTFDIIFIQDELTAENLYEEKDTQILNQDEIPRLEDYFREKLAEKVK